MRESLRLVLWFYISVLLIALPATFVVLLIWGNEAAVKFAPFAGGAAAVFTIIKEHYGKRAN
jgi:hypothetical protein